MSETKTPDWADERRPAVTASLGRGRLSSVMNAYDAARREKARAEGCCWGCTCVRVQNRNAARSRAFIKAVSHRTARRRLKARDRCIAEAL